MAGGPAGLHGQSFAKVGIVGAQFLKIEVGARSLAMGSASMAAVNDASAVFWNPSGLTSIENTSTIISHMSLFAGLNYEAGSLVKRVPGIGLFGLFFSYLTSGEMEETTIEEQQGTGKFFSYSDIMVGVTFARALTNQFSFGGNVKLVREDFGFNDNIEGIPVVSQAIAFDIGTQYLTGFRSLRMGLAIQNFGPELTPAGKFSDIIGFDSKTQTYTLDAEKKFKSYPMPMTFRAGIAMEVFERSGHVIMLAADVLHPSDNIERVHLGAEYLLLNVLALRGGYVVNADAQRFTLGTGLDLGVVSFDYAYLDYGILSSVQTFSAVFRF